MTRDTNSGALHGLEKDLLDFEASVTRIADAFAPESPMSGNAAGSV